jgi:hypothetical protein
MTPLRVLFWTLVVTLAMSVILQVWIYLQERSSRRMRVKAYRLLKEVHAIMVVLVEVWPDSETRPKLQGALVALRKERDENDVEEAPLRPRQTEAGGLRAAIQEGTDAARMAYHEANTVNRKLEKLGYEQREDRIKERKDAEE